MLNFVHQNPELSITLATIIVALIFYRQMAIAWLKKEIPLLMLSGEKLSKKNITLKGEQLMEMVVQAAVDGLIARYPFVRLLFINEGTVKKLAQFLHDKSRDLLDDGKLNHSYWIG